MHESVVAASVKSVLASSAKPLAQNEVFVQAAGGSPEGIVGAILAGFSHVAYVAATDEESALMRVPAEAEEASLDYTNYTSPDPFEPDQGTLAIAAMKPIAKMIKNFVLDTPGTEKVPPPWPAVRGS